MLDCRDNETDNDEYEAFLRYQHSWRSQNIPSFGEYPPITLRDSRWHIILSAWRCKAPKNTLLASGKRKDKMK